jgi:hypothetical protein
MTEERPSLDELIEDLIEVGIDNRDALLELTSELADLRTEISAVKDELADKPGKMWLTTAIGLLIAAYAVWGVVGDVGDIARFAIGAVWLTVPKISAFFDNNPEGLLVGAVGVVVFIALVGWIGGREKHYEP